MAHPQTVIIPTGDDHMEHLHEYFGCQCDCEDCTGTDDVCICPDCPHNACAGLPEYRED